MNAKRPFIIGIVGAIGSGKTTVAKELETLGAVRIDADQLCHALLEQPDVIDAIATQWDSEVLDANGRVNRRAVADRVFEDKEQLDKLNTILHPRVKKILHDRIEHYTQRDPGVKIVLEVALLIESGLADLCDTILYVETERGLRERRTTQGRDWTLQELQRREQHQVSNECKKAAAKIIINNSGTRTETRQQLTRIWRDLPG